MSRNLAICLGWLLIVVVALAIIANRLSTSYDLGVLLPDAKTPAEQVLVERVGKSPGANLLFVGLQTTDPALIQTLIDTLNKSHLYRRVFNPRQAFDLDDLPETVNVYRYLLDERSLTEEFISEQFAARAKELRLVGGRQFADLVSRDPTLAAAHVLTSIAEFSTPEPDEARDAESTVILVETIAPGFDIGAQREAIEHVNRTLTDVFGEAATNSRLSGVGVIGTLLEAQIRREAQTRSITASVVVILILFIAYRRFGPVLQAVLPVIAGAIVALAVLTLVTDRVHGITLAFGFTLLGVGVDYPVHYLSHSRRSEAFAAIKTIWPTLRLSVASTLLAYVALTLSGSEGTRQLGIFTVAGLVTIVLATRYLLPSMAALGMQSKPNADMPQAPLPIPSDANGAARLRWTPVAVIAIGSLLMLLLSWQGDVFDDDLSRLSPVSDELIAKDQDLRDAAGSPDARILIAVRQQSLEQVLQATERVDNKLRQMTEGVLTDWLAVNRVLPSQNTQQKRRDALPDTDELTGIIERAAKTVEFNPRIFSAFVESVRNSRQLDPLGPDHYSGSPLEALIQSQLYESENQWISLIALHSQASSAQLMNALLEIENQLTEDNAVIVDLKGTSENLVERYRQGVGYVLFVAIFAIVALLIRQTTVRRGCWAMSATLVSVFAASSLVYARGGLLDLYHMIALLLVAGLVLDYALFLSRDDASTRSRQDTRHAVLTCAASTIAAFALLAMSSIPALRSLGSIVSTGALVGLGLCWWSTQIQPIRNQPASR